MAWPKGRPRGPRPVPVGTETSNVADLMDENESAELDEMVGDTQPVDGGPEIQTEAAAQKPAEVPSAPPSTAACEFCDANPKIPSKGFDCGCHRRQTVEGKLASARYKEAANKK